MKNTVLTLTLLIASTCAIKAQTKENIDVKYRRSSLYTVMVNSSNLPYSEEIKKYFQNSPIPEKFNDHNLDKRVIDAPMQLAQNTPTANSVSVGLVAAITNVPVANDYSKKPTEQGEKEANEIARNLVAKWFNRSAKGGFSMSLIQNRGSYDATVLDIAKAKSSKRGVDLLSDAGEELIQKTFVLVNEFKYTNKEEVAKKTNSWLSMAGTVASYAGVPNASNIATLASAGVAVAGKGYIVKTKGHLYQLIWNEEVATIFYNEYWADDKTITPAKRKAFDESNIFKLKYIGTDESWADVQSSVFTNKSEVQLVEKATMKAVDAVIVKLQKTHDEFKTKTPLYTGEPITAKIGLKEGLSKKSKFDVLEQQIDENGKTKYVSVGTIKIDTKYPIWDNRFAANEENPNSTIDRTYFKKVSGKNFYPGMLIVQKKGK